MWQAGTSTPMYFSDIASALSTSTTAITSLLNFAYPVVIALIGLSLGALLITLVRTRIPAAIRKGLGGRRGRRGRRR